MADLAIDGYYWPNFADGHASHTGTEAKPFWELWWPYDVNISQLDIYPGSDLEGFQNIAIKYLRQAEDGWDYVPGENMTTSGQSAPWNWGTIVVPPAPLYTRAIHIESNTGPFIELAEVAVHGWYY